MSHLLDHGTGEVWLTNLAWMAGNLWLAWVGLLLVWLVLPQRRRAAWSARVLIGSAVVGVVVVALTDRDQLKGIPDEWILAPAALVTVCVIVALRFGERHRWIQGVVALMAVVFAPNSPYVLTDLLHLVQDLRVGQLDSAESLLFSIQYGVFVIAGAVPWILLLGLGRKYVRRRWPNLRLFPVLLAACVVTAFAIYVGRIERLHSFHLVTQPVVVLRAFGHAFTDRGVALFVVCWTVLLLFATSVTLWAVDRIRRVGGSGRELVVPAMFALAGMFLAGSPSLASWDRAYGLATATPNGADAAACYLGGVILGSIGMARLATVLGLIVARTVEPTLEHDVDTRPSLVPVFALGYIVLVPVVGTLLIGGATVQWWAQYRGLCDFAPAQSIHRERCP